MKGKQLPSNTYRFIWIILCSILFVACKKTNDNLAEDKEKVKLYIMAGTGIYQSGTPPPSMHISGTNIETVNDVTGTWIIEAHYPKGEKQKIELTGNTTETALYLQVSKDLVVADPDRLTEEIIVYKAGKGKISVEFMPLVGASQ